MISVQNWLSGKAFIISQDRTVLLMEAHLTKSCRSAYNQTSNPPHKFANITIGEKGNIAGHRAHCWCLSQQLVHGGSAVFFFYFKFNNGNQRGCLLFVREVRRLIGFALSLRRQNSAVNGQKDWRYTEPNAEVGAIHRRIEEMAHFGIARSQGARAALARWQHISALLNAQLTGLRRRGVRRRPIHWTTSWNRELSWP